MSLTPSTDEQPARPSNAFMLYRTDQHRIMKQNADAPGRESDISKQIGKKWKAEPEEVKKLYKARAAATAAEHKRRYPNYKFTPNRRGDGKKRSRATVPHAEATNGPQPPSQVPSVLFNLPFLSSAPSSSASPSGSPLVAQTASLPHALAMALQQDAVLAFQQLQYARMIHVLAARRQMLRNSMGTIQNTMANPKAIALPQLPTAGFAAHDRVVQLRAQQPMLSQAQLSPPSTASTSTRAFNNTLAHNALVRAPDAVEMSPLLKKKNRVEVPGWEAPLNAGFYDFTTIAPATCSAVQRYDTPSSLAPSTPSSADSLMTDDLPAWKVEPADESTSMMDLLYGPLPGENVGTAGPSTTAVKRGEDADAAYDALDDAQGDWEDQDNAEYSFEGDNAKAWFTFQDEDA